MGPAKYRGDAEIPEKPSPATEGEGLAEITKLIALKFR
jgi:hypothetical protein